MQPRCFDLVYNIPYDRVQSCNSWQSLFITGDGIDNHIQNYRYKLQSSKYKVVVIQINTK